MININAPKTFYCFGLFLGLWLLASCITSAEEQAEEVKYYSGFFCNDYMKLNIRCKFWNQVDIKNKDVWSHWQVHYKAGKAISAVMIYVPAINGIKIPAYGNNKCVENECPALHPDNINFDYVYERGIPIIGEKLEFDPKDRLASRARYPHRFTADDPYSLCKYNYKEQLRETKCFDKKNELTKRMIFYYGDNKFIEQRNFDGLGKLTGVYAAD